MGSITATASRDMTVRLWNVKAIERTADPLSAEALIAGKLLRCRQVVAQTEAQYHSGRRQPAAQSLYVAVTLDAHRLPWHRQRHLEKRVESATSKKLRKRLQTAAPTSPPSSRLRKGRCR